ncbi:Thioredoxin [Enhygromyxa salina]|uniref:Thioredoxin n=1 Tax=Enhygromyxa salina TaxID=215803 RepID=A0A2S9Y003_9BACT|nr:thioredoxin family protein [Enhygromyxa salina]PRP98300.1 Thioredoxin [Enhygromyxa salina]
MNYATEQPDPKTIESLEGPAVLIFGTNWCGFCQAAQAMIEQVLSDVRRVEVEDGRGRKLGRMFRVKLWPTLIFLRDGVEVARVVRPQAPAELAAALATLKASATGG